MTSSVIQMGSGGSPALSRGRLAFIVDATGSRAATWAIARELQADMFRAAAPIGQLDLQLVFFGGEQCRSSKWTTSGDQLAQLMSKVECEPGETQIERALRHVLREHTKAPLQAVTLIGDACEEEPDALSSLAGQLGAAGVPVFAFCEGNNPTARRVFRMLALRSGGAFYEFNVASKQAVGRLSEQLGAVARLAVGDNSVVLAIAGKKE
jgi:hypothetical protein